MNGFLDEGFSSSNAGKIEQIEINDAFHCGFGRSTNNISIKMIVCFRQKSKISVGK